MRWRRACACAVMCALLAVAGAAVDDAAVAALEAQLLGLLGLPRRPPRPNHRRPPAVPPALSILYHKDSLPAAAANTARSYHHTPTHLDHRFPNEHRFRLYFNVSGVAADELARGADVIFQRTPSPGGHQRLLLYDVVRPGRKGKTAPILRLLDSVPLRPDGGNVTTDALGAARRWLTEPDHNHGLLVRVVEEGDGTNDARQPHVRVRRRASEDEDSWRERQPLLLLYTEDARAREAREKTDTKTRLRRAARRGRRGHHRRKEARDICQRRPLFVDFADVGWSEWIVAPQGYDAYYCSGDCPFPLADHLNGTNHAIVQTLVNSVNPAAVPKACCVPTQLSPISMLYVDEMNNVVLKNYQDMVVVGCGCR